MDKLQQLKDWLQEEIKESVNTRRIVYERVLRKIEEIENSGYIPIVSMIIDFLSELGGRVSLLTFSPDAYAALRKVAKNANFEPALSADMFFPFYNQHIRILEDKLQEVPIRAYKEIRKEDLRDES